MRIFLLTLVVFALASCGGRSNSSRGSSVAFATGPMYSACLEADRKNASRALCGCIQAVANGDLSSRDQTRAARFFEDPQRAQDTRQSDNSTSEVFWKRYRAYADKAERACRSAA